MDFSVGELVTAGSLIAGVAAAFGALSYRLRALEKQPNSGELDKKVEAVRTSQGLRLGDLEDRISKVEGFMLGVRYRKKTKPAGEPIT